MPEDVVALLEELLRLPGLSGHEGPVRERLRQAWEPLSDEIAVSRLGSLHAWKRGRGPEPRPCLMLAAHMDAIGLMVSEVVDGFLRVTEVGGLDPRVLPGQPVVVHAERDLPGLVVQPPPNCLAEEHRKEVVPIEGLLVDVGLPAGQVARLVRPGHLISFAQEPLRLNDDLFVGRSLDNRASLAALTICLQELQRLEHDWDVVAVATTQEEETFAGALTSAFALRPAVAVAVDVTFARAPGVPEHRSFPLGEGPTNLWGPNVHPAVHKALKETAERHEIPLATEYAPTHSGTDAYALQIAGEGLPTGVVSIPLRNMHTPVEMVSLKDIRRAGRLLALLAAGLRPDFTEQLTWD